MPHADTALLHAHIVQLLVLVAGPQRLLQLVGTERVLALGGVAARLLALLCRPGAPTAGLCKQAVFAIAGRSPELFDAVSTAAPSGCLRAGRH